MTSEYGVYTWASQSIDLLIGCLNGYELLIIGSNEGKINEFKGCMMAEFEMSDLGSLPTYWEMKLFQQIKECACTRKGMQQILNI